jgi:glycosyltransferase involved in cell wall biosynthesis
MVEMRIVFLTQVVDADHPVLAQTLDMVRALAARCDEVVVVCDRLGRHDLPANVTFRTFGSRTRLGRGLRFQRAVLESVVRRRPDAVLAHMVPLFLLLAAPAARLRRVPLLLWYTHWHAGRSLRAATRLADAVLSVDGRSFPLATPKLVATGHAIDVETFRPLDGAPVDPSGPLRLRAIGRTARWKGYETLLGAVGAAAARGVAADVEIRGPSTTADERRHRVELEAAVAASPLLRGRVQILEAVPRERLPELLARADAVVSPTQPGPNDALDKAVLEAAACAVPVISSNAALAPLLEGLPLRLTFPPRDAAALGDLIVGLAGADPHDREETGRELRRRVAAAHSLETWADRVVEVVRGLAGPARTGAGRLRA